MRLVITLLLLAGCDKVFRFDEHPPDAAPTPPKVWTSLDSGVGHTCAIRDDETLWCWGRNTRGQLGDNTTLTSAHPVQVVGDPKWKQVSAGLDSSCGVTVDGELYCWGDNDEGQLGQGNNNGSTRILVVGTEKDWTSVSINTVHACGIRADHSLWCWGNDSAGALGNAGVNVGSLVPLQIAGEWREVAAGVLHACAIKVDGTLWCWGNDSFQQAGIPGIQTRHEVPVQVGTATNWRSVSTEGLPDIGTHVCATHDDDVTECWGENDYGQSGLGTGPGSSRIDPTRLARDYVQISAGGEHTCGVTRDGEMYCWGRNDRGQLGVGTSEQSFADGRLIPGTWKSVAAGAAHTCAIDIAGAISCTGAAGDGSLGDDSFLPQVSPMLVDEGFTKISTGSGHVCGLKGSELWCWGANRSAQLADATLTPQQRPTRIGTVTADAITAGHDQTCLRRTTTLECWGANTNGNIGNNTTTMVTSPTQIGTGTMWAFLDAGAHTCAGTAGGVAYCWGPATDGKLGTAAQMTPMTAVSGGYMWKQISASRDNTCGIRANDEVYCWGSNTNGQLGELPTFVGASSQLPLLVRTGMGTAPPSQTLLARSIAVGEGFACAITATNLLYCWGRNSNAELGLGNRSTGLRGAQQVLGTWTAVAAGASHACAIDLQKRIACWGIGTSGQLGDGQLISRQVPTIVQGSGAWIAVDARSSYTCGITDANQLYCWGLGEFGQLGLPNAWRTTFAPIATVE